ncbi:MAG: nitroreductase family protein, partial [Spirochaetia bacterium]
MIDTMKKRRSVRTFEDKPLRPADLSFVQAQTVQLGETTGPFGHRVRPDFRIVQGGRSSGGERIGTYGVIRNAQAFVGVVVENKPGAMVDVGYLFEGFILDVTAQGLGTCWLGGTFNRKTLSGRVKVNEGEVLPII